MSTIKAIRATIKLGDIQIDGYQLPDGIYKVSTQTFKETLNSLIGNSTGKKYLKPILGASKSIVENVKIEGYNRSITMYGLDTFSEVVAAYAQLGNQRAIAILVACMSESLERRFDHAFGVQRTEEERNDRLIARLKGKEARRTLTDVIQDWLASHPEASENTRRFVYANCSDCLNKVVLGYKSKKAKELLGIPQDSLLRDAVPRKALTEIEAVERLATILIDDDDIEPLEAVKKAIQDVRARQIAIPS